MSKVIEKYLKDKLENETQLPVIIDGNRHDLKRKFAMLRCDAVTLDKCKEIVNKLHKHIDYRPSMLKILMTCYDYNAIDPVDYEYVLSGDIPLKIIGVYKEAIYYVNDNCLQIWENGRPVYENWNGQITEDVNVLADCLM
jgi:hypothetical protein